jgi:hypothetical protein
MPWAPWEPLQDIHTAKALKPIAVDVDPTHVLHDFASAFVR